jgi:patatin-like phospholipase/acyl hydrolase
MKIEIKFPYITAMIVSTSLVVGSFVAYHYQQRSAIISAYSNLDQNPKPLTRTLPSKKNQEYIRILSIEGGGVYGILPAHVLQYIEKKSKRPIAELFDLVMGTSTGSLLSVLLTVPGLNNKPKYTAADALAIYKDQGKMIFYSPWYHRIFTLNGLIGPKFMTTERMQVFREYFGNLYFDQLLNNVIIPAYGVKDRSPLLFMNWRQPGAPNMNFAVSDLLMGAVSPPGFFPSVVFGSPKDRFLLADGAIFANNPDLAAVLIAMKMYPKKKYILVSLGTGKVERSAVTSKEVVDWGDLQWSEEILPVLMDGTMKFNDLLLEKTFPFPIDIYSFNIEIDSFSREIDNITPWHLERLNQDGERLVKDNQKKLDELIPKLLRP